MPRTYVDTNVFVEAIEKRGRLSDLATALLVATPALIPQRLVTSELTFAELLVRPLRLKQKDYIRTYQDWMISNDYLEVVPVIGSILFGAAMLRSQNNSIKLPDAIHVTTAREKGCRYFLTNDGQITADLGIEVLRLTESDLSKVLEGTDDASL
jgi:predicted nucleic acid-binding protein